MLLEQIVQKRTLADAFIANDRLRDIAAVLGYFYGFQALLAGLGLSYLALGVSWGSFPLFVLVETIGVTPLILLLLISLGVALIYGLIVLSLWIAAQANSPVLSGLTATFSTVLHIGALLLLGANGGLWLFSSINSSGRGLDLNGLAQILGFSGATSPALVLLLIINCINLLIWLVLLFKATSRSIRALISAFRTAPGTYRYSYSTTVLSASQKSSEVAFLENALRTSAMSYYYNNDESENIYDPQSYLIRFVHRNGKVLAASLQKRRTRELLAVFPGRESPELNAAILLEDSYLIQKALRPSAHASLSRDHVVEDAARAGGWIVNTEVPGVLELQRD